MLEAFFKIFGAHMQVLAKESLYLMFQTYFERSVTSPQINSIALNLIVCPWSAASLLIQYYGKRSLCTWSDCPILQFYRALCHHRRCCDDWASLSSPQFLFLFSPLLEIVGVLSCSLLWYCPLPDRTWWNIW